MSSGLVLAGCGTADKPAETTEAGIYNAGTYSAFVKGYSSYITATMTFGANEITGCPNLTGAKAVIQIAEDVLMGGKDYYLTSTWHLLCADEDNPYTSTVAAVEPGFELY